MTPLDTLHRMAMAQGIGIRRADPDRYDLVNSDDDSVIAHQLTIDEVTTFLRGDFFEPS
jgi:hypothetical protein